jgi:hypothetical protein
MAPALLPFSRGEKEGARPRSGWEDEGVRRPPTSAPPYARPAWLESWLALTPILANALDHLWSWS